MTWYVYGLMVPATGYIAYVGMTAYPRERFNQHRSDAASSANHLFDRADGCADPVMVLIKDFPTRAEALLFEANLINAGVGCSNKEYRMSRMWHHLRELLGDERGELLLEQIMESARDCPDDGLFDNGQIRVTGSYLPKSLNDDETG